MPSKRQGKGYALAFFILLFCLQPCASEDRSDFPVINRLNSRDIGFKQYIGDVEENRKRLSGSRGRPGFSVEEPAAQLTIFKYTPVKGDDVFSISARCNIPYSALVSLNRLSSPGAIQTGRPILLPSCPGIFMPENTETDLEKLTGAARFGLLESVKLKISAAGYTEIFHFFPGADYTPTERAFFLNTGFRFPLRSYRLTSAYGQRKSPFTGNMSMHHGIDLAAPAGTEVYAAADGIVTALGEDPVYGIYVIITHGERWSSLYGHLQKTETVLRSAVKSGSLIGRVGSTGQSTGPHLHFELRQDGRALNPEGYLR
ncbi:MAG: M23 family metallopeptidase [Treponema sp.]|nr:M23 family metallopeptidase [Treponema sp.]